MLLGVRAKRIVSSSSTGGCVLWSVDVRTGCSGLLMQVDVKADCRCPSLVAPSIIDMSISRQAARPFWARRIRLP